eukprot:GHVP01030892.1.p1 GENE.GHVP01030892.1~~GHVP01030892.1.p1  ORF type:complete len:278 (+),score=53.71 GHVP01030892.1:17-850(+)
MRETLDVHEFKGTTSTIGFMGIPELLSLSLLERECIEKLEEISSLKSIGSEEEDVICSLVTRNIIRLPPQLVSKVPFKGCSRIAEAFFSNPSTPEEDSIAALVQDPDNLLCPFVRSICGNPFELVRKATEQIKATQLQRILERLRLWLDARVFLSPAHIAAELGQPDDSSVPSMRYVVRSLSLFVDVASCVLTSARDGTKPIPETVESAIEEAIQNIIISSERSLPLVTRYTDILGFVYQASLLEDWETSNFPAKDEKRRYVAPCELLTVTDAHYID